MSKYLSNQEISLSLINFNGNYNGTNMITLKQVNI
jgi:hypothetical protein